MALDLSKVVSEISEIHFADVATVLKEKLTAEEYVVAESNAAQVRVFNIRYRSNNRHLSGYIIEPREMHHVLPAVIFNRGGTGHFGAIKPGLLFGKLATYSLWGYVVFASQYAGGPGSEGQDEWGGADVDDVAQLHSVIAAHAYADTERIGVIGVSRGGMMTHLLLKRVPWVRAAVTIGGVSNLLRMKSFRPEMWQMYRTIFGDAVDVACAERSILFDVASMSSTPILLLHGAADKHVSPLDSIELAAAMLSHSKPYRLIVYESADHSLQGFEAEASVEIRQWLDRFVRDGETLPEVGPRGDRLPFSS